MGLGVLTSLHSAWQTPAKPLWPKTQSTIEEESWYLLILLILKTALSRGLEENPPNRQGSGNRQIKTPSNNLGEEHQKAVSHPLPAEVLCPSQSVSLLEKWGWEWGVQGKGRVLKAAAAGRAGP